MTSIAGMSLSPTMHLEGTWPSLGLSERLLALLPWGEVGGVTAEMSLSVSVCHTNSGRTTNGLVYQSFLSHVFFFVCALSSIHLFMLPLSSPFSPPPTPLLLRPPPTRYTRLSLSTCLSDFAAVVRRSAGGHAGFPRGQAARRQPAAPSQPGHTLPAHQHAPTE